MILKREEELTEESFRVTVAIYLEGRACTTASFLPHSCLHR